MVIPHSKRRKVSSRLKQARLDLEQRLKSEFGRRFAYYDLLSDNTNGFVLITTQREEAAARVRPLFLVELANLREDGVANFQKTLSKRFFVVSDRGVLQLRDELRAIWNLGEADSVRAAQIMSGWLRWKPREEVVRGNAAPYSPFFPSIMFGIILLDTRNFHAQITQAVLERSEYQRICGNPDCVNPYFLARRNDQKYCEAGSCTIYGHRRAALDYWHRQNDPKDEPTKRTTKKGKVHAKGKTQRKKAR